MTKMRVSVVVDTPESWMNGYAKELVRAIHNKGYEATFYNKYEDIPEGGIAIFLSCEKIVPKSVLKKSVHNLVVHESDLPAGKGWSPFTWQVLQGKNKIPITFFEAAEKVDAGLVYYKDVIKLEGHELIDEMREKQAAKTFELVLRFLDAYPNVKGEPQKGKESFYRKRTPADSELNIDKTIREQINLLRVVDNERYPAFFYYNGRKYILKIYKGVD